MERIVYFLTIYIFLVSITAQAQQPPKVGREAAAKYLNKDKESEESEKKINYGDNFLYLIMGPFANSTSYAWKGSDKRTGIAKTNYALTYLFKEWNSIDVNIRAEFTEFSMDDEKPLKFSIMPLWTIPLVESRFPLYFGLGAGLGIFLKQIDQESNLSFDYQLVTGIRIPELIENTGFVVELALKNHIHLLSDGQFTGTSIGVGAVFAF